MSLDFAIRDDNGKPRVSIHLDDNTHFNFIENAINTRKLTCLRFCECYEDAEVYSEEMAALQAELKSMMNDNIDSNT